MEAELNSEEVKAEYDRIIAAGALTPALQELLAKLVDLHPKPGKNLPQILKIANEAVAQRRKALEEQLKRYYGATGKHSPCPIVVTKGRNPRIVRRPAAGPIARVDVSSRLEPLGTDSEWSRRTRGIGSIPARWRVAAAAALALVIGGAAVVGAWAISTKPFASALMITSPESGAEFIVDGPQDLMPGDGRLTILVEGTGRTAPGALIYVVVEVAGEQYVQDCVAIRGGTGSWRCPVHIGDARTPAGLKFMITVVSERRRLVSGEDYDPESHRVWKPISRDAAPGIEITHLR